MEDSLSYEQKLAAFKKNAKQNYRASMRLEGIEMYDIKQMVKGDKQVTFVRYRKGELIYTTDCGFEFPVPIDDVGDGVFLAKDRAMLFMRYIRKHIKSIEETE